MSPWPHHLTALLVFSAAQSYASAGGNAIMFEVSIACNSLYYEMSTRAGTSAMKVGPHIFPCSHLQYFNDWLGSSSNISTVSCSMVIVLNNVFGVVGSLWADWRVGVRNASCFSLSRARMLAPCIL